MPFIELPPIVILYTTKVQYPNQEIEIGTILLNKPKTLFQPHWFLHTRTFVHVCKYITLWFYCMYK